MNNNSNNLFIILTLFLSLSYCCISQTINSLNNNNVKSVWQRTDDEVMALYEEWMTEHRKVYNILEERIDRFEIFKENLRYIEEHNNLPNTTFQLGLNQFSHLTNEEFESMYLSGITKHIHNDDELESDDNLYVGEFNYSSSKLPDYVDWREKGAVNPIKDQGRCGSCWSFSTIASVEAINQIQNGVLVSLSEQMLLDCVTSNDGCKGGTVSNSFNYMKTYGVALNEDYPYVGFKGECQNKPIAVKIDGFKLVFPRSELRLLPVVANQVVSIAIKAASRDFQHYKSGVFSGQCGPKLSHGMDVVGYGHENGGKYWILRNSWGETWGEKGYMRIARNVPGYYRGYCGMAEEATYPVMRTSVNQELLSDV